MTEPALVNVAVPVPLRRLFAYQLGSEHNPPAPGCRVRVPFGGRTLIGVVLEPGAPEEVPAQTSSP